MADRTVTSSMTSRDPERSKSWPSYKCKTEGLSGDWLTDHSLVHVNAVQCHVLGVLQVVQFRLARWLTPATSQTTTSANAEAPRDGASRQIPFDWQQPSAVNSRRLVVHCILHSSRLPSMPGAVNTRPTAVAVYRALADGRLLCRILCNVRIAESEPYCHSICLSVCLDVCRSFRDLQPTTIDRSQPNLVGRTRVSLFGSPVSHTLGARGKNMENFAYLQRVFLQLRTWCIVPYDLSVAVCPSVCILSVPPSSRSHFMLSALVANKRT